MQEQVLATYGLVAQLVAQLLCKQKVTGSSPVPSTTKTNSDGVKYFRRREDEGPNVQYLYKLGIMHQ